MTLEEKGKKMQETIARLRENRRKQELLLQELMSSQQTNNKQEVAMFRIIDGQIEVTIKKGARVGMTDGTFTEPPNLLIRAEEPSLGPWDADFYPGITCRGTGLDEGAKVAEALWATLPQGVVEGIRDELDRRFKAMEK